MEEESIATVIPFIRQSANTSENLPLTPQGGIEARGTKKSVEPLSPSVIETIM